MSESNSTMACSIVAQKSNVKVAHVEAGIRSRDWTMPEEINRKIVDHLSDINLVLSDELISIKYFHNVFAGNTLSNCAFSKPT